MSRSVLRIIQAAEVIYMWLNVIEVVEVDDEGDEGDVGGQTWRARMRQGGRRAS